MKKMWSLDVFLAIVFMLGLTSNSYAGSDRIMIAVPAAQVDKANLVFVRFSGPDGAALESDVLKQMVIHDHDCSSEHIFELVTDYKMGYAPKKFVVGIYLFPHTWSGNALCFSVPGIGKVEQRFNPSAGSGRYFDLKLVP